MRRSPSARYVASRRIRSGVSAGAELLQRPLERLAAENRRTGVLELAEAWIEPRSERMRAQEPVAEAVDGRDPRAVELAREIVSPALVERSPNAAAELARRLPRVRDDQDRLDVDAAVADRADVALDEDRGLPRAGTGRDEHRALGFDGGELLVVQRARRVLDDGHARATRHIGQRSHHDGHPSPFGSWRTSPAWMRRAFSAARSRADSTWLQKVSSSR